MRAGVLLAAVTACTGGRTVLTTDGGEGAGAGDAGGQCAPRCEVPCDEVRDRDGDGFVAGAGGDCDDSDATTFPGAPDGSGWSVQAAPFAHWSVLMVGELGEPTIASGDVYDPSCAYHPPNGDSPSYYVAYRGMVVHERRAGAWQAERLDDACAFLGPAAARSPNGDMILAYALAAEWAETMDWVVRLARRRAGLWSLEDLEGGSPHLAVAVQGCSGGLLAVGSCRRDGPCRFSVSEPPEGSPDLLEEVPGRALGAVVDEAGAAYVSLFVRVVGEPGEVLLASRTAPDGDWHLERAVETCAGCLVYGSDVAVAGGAAHVAFASHLGVNVATRDEEGLWQVEQIDDAPPASESSPEVGPIARITMKADPAGYLHVAYAVDDELTQGQVLLRYATNRSGDWEVQGVGWPMVQMNVRTAAYPSLAIDPRGTLHLAWYATGEVGSPFVEEEGLGRYAVLSRPRDGIDQNCDGVDGVDADGDGRASRETGGDDPDDTSPAR